MTFEFKKCLIEGLYEVQPELHGDDNCNLVEVYVEKGFKEAGLMLDFVQDDQAQFSKNYLYGLRFQKKHSQGKLIPKEIHRLSLWCGEAFYTDSN